MVAECSECRTIYHVQVGDDALLETLYDVWLNDIADHGDQRELQWLAQHPRQSRDGHEIMTAASLLNTSVKGLKTLDFGMGMGLWAGIARALGCDSHGFDLSEKRMQEARAKGIRTVAYDEIPGSEFDYINTEQVMEHVTDVRAVMSLLSRGLRRGGLLKISIPAQGNVREGLARVRAGEVVPVGDIIPAQPLEHVNALSVSGIERMGRDFGLTPILPSTSDRLRFAFNPANWASTNLRNMLKELVRPFIPYDNDRNLTVWLQAK